MASSSICQSEAITKRAPALKKARAIPTTPSALIFPCPLLQQLQSTSLACNCASNTCAIHKRKSSSLDLSELARLGDKIISAVLNDHELQCVPRKLPSACSTLDLLFCRVLSCERLDVFRIGAMNGPLKFLTARKILPLPDLLAKFKRVLACSCSPNFCSYLQGKVNVILYGA